MICEMCTRYNYPSPSTENFFCDKKMVCRECYLSDLKKEREKIKLWINNTKKILIKKLKNNDPCLAKTIISFVYDEKEYENPFICSYCNENIYNINTSNKYYYYICSTCLDISL